MSNQAKMSLRYREINSKAKAALLGMYTGAEIQWLEKIEKQEAPKAPTDWR
jgi:hypothetical protein